MSRFILRDYIDDRIGVRLIAHGGHGEELVCTCPFCDGREKLYVNAARGAWVCYKCGEKGDMVKLVREVDGLSRTEALKLVYEDAVRVARPFADLASRAAAAADPEPTLPEPDGLTLPDEFVPIFDGKTWRIPDYLRARRIQARIAASYGIGFCDSGRYGGRIVLPAHVQERLAFFQARSMTGAEPKYLAPPVDRSGVLWGFDEALGSARVLVVEGPFDVLGCAQAGLPAVALMGKKCSSAQAVLLASAFERGTVLLDPEASRDAAAVVMILGAVMEVDLARLPDGVDPGDAPREAIREAVAGARAPTLRDRFLTAG